MPSPAGRTGNLHGPQAHQCRATDLSAPYPDPRPTDDAPKADPHNSTPVPASEVPTAHGLTARLPRPDWPARPLSHRGDGRAALADRSCAPPDPNPCPRSPDDPAAVRSPLR